VKTNNLQTFYWEKRHAVKKDVECFKLYLLLLRTHAVKKDVEQAFYVLHALFAIIMSYRYQTFWGCFISTQ
jgi:hypothetical protein